ncbi:Nucleoside-diphosphate-sugar epimerase [Sphingomonas guangdongensis]|uniref:Nucleoside-diphosphate-sugar epimerase n=1 Tax=Sphingomonas guangdongensis TaxID=1141890 RepID=A0A285QGD6_9SPHN|nr:Nucleoside-diphosphate-sugar epimerase [Sphingomonas guangdongensis]
MSRGLKVRAGVRSTSDLSRLQRLAPAADPMVFDLAGPTEQFAAALDGIDLVVHCAAYGVDYRQRDFDTGLAANVSASVRLAEAVAARGARLIHVGTSYEYGTEDGVLTEDRRLAPVGVYGVTKAAATLALQDLARRTGASLAVVRPFSMYGPLEGEHKFVPLVMAASRSGSPLDLTPGDQQRDYLYVGDVSDACLDLGSSNDFPSGEVFNLASGSGLRLRDVALAAVHAAGGDVKVLRWGAKPYRPAESMRVVGDANKIARAIGWRATTSLVTGMRLTAAADLC